MRLHGVREPLVQATVSWDFADAAGTEKKVAVTPPSNLSHGGKYLISIRNASVVSELTGLVKNLEPYLATGGTYAELMRFAIPVSGDLPIQKLVKGWCTTEESGATAPGQLILTNDTAVAASGRRMASIVIRKF